MTHIRNRAFDGVRGVAAVAVAFSHAAALQWVPGLDDAAPDTLRFVLWHLGAPAVDVFFALSGLVLARSLMEHPTGAGRFIAARAARLMPMAWTAVLAGLAVRAWGITPPAHAGGLMAVLQLPLAWSDVVGLATMVAPIPRAELVNPPLWTLVVEMQAAFLMPAMVMVAATRPATLAVCSVCMMTAIWVLLGWAHPVQFAGFMAGATYAAVRHRVSTPPRPTVMLIVSIALLCGRMMPGFDDPMYRIAGAIGAIGILMAVEAGAAETLLTSRAAQALGRISYPFYALHFPLMALSASTFGWALGTTGAGLAALPVAFMIATFAEQWVDRPAVRVAERIRNRGRTAAVSQMRRDVGREG